MDCLCMPLRKINAAIRQALSTIHKARVEVLPQVPNAKDLPITVFISVPGGIIRKLSWLPSPCIPPLRPNRPPLRMVIVYEVSRTGGHWTAKQGLRRF
jgi:hypothetical protein